MKQLFTEVEARLAAGEAVVLCTVVASHGSTPRGAGARMAVFQDGSFAGTIGGGPVEFAALCRARQPGTEPGWVEDYCLRPEDAAGLGMVCGGDVTVCFQRLRGEDDRERVRAALELLHARRDAWCLIELENGAPAAWGTWDRERGLQGMALAPEILAPLLAARPVLTEGEPRYFAAPLVTGARVYVFGGGHVSQELAPLLAHLDFSVVVLENRAEFARPELFPGVLAVKLTDFSTFAAEVELCARDAIVIMTRGHRDDYEVLREALATPAGYLGVIGSRQKAKHTRERLREDGYREADIARIHTPIGLPIGAETPAEIAVSVAAELIAYRAGQGSEAPAM